MSVGVHSTYQFNSSFSEGSYVEWLLDQLDNKCGSPEGEWAKYCYTPTRPPCVPPSMAGTDPWVSLGLHWSQKVPSREEEKGQAHRAIPFGSLPRNVLLAFHALRCWQVCKWQTLKDSPLWHSAGAKSWTNRLLSTIWSLWLPELVPWTTSSKNANFSFSKWAWQINLSK